MILNANKLFIHTVNYYISLFTQARQRLYTYNETRGVIQIQESSLIDRVKILVTLIIISLNALGYYSWIQLRLWPSKQAAYN
jgi:hypothetical protein